QDIKDINIYVDYAMEKVYKSFFSFINNIYAEKKVLIHSDIYKSMQILSFDGNRYLITFIDDVIKFIYDFLISNKKINIILEIFKIFKNLIKTKFIKYIQIIHIDNNI